MAEETDQGTKFNRKLIAKFKFYTVVALLLQLAGFASPGWLVRRINIPDTNENVMSDHLHLGLWYKVDCHFGSSCEVNAIFSGKNASYKEVHEQEIACTIAVILTSVSLVLVVQITQRTLVRDAFSRLVYAMILWLLSAAVSFYAVGSQAHDEIQFSKRNDTDNKTSSTSVGILFPYSLLVFGVGALALCLTFLIVLRHVIEVRRKRQAEMRLRMLIPAIIIEEYNGDQICNGDNNMNNENTDNGNSSIEEHSMNDDSGSKKNGLQSSENNNSPSVVNKTNLQLENVELNLRL